MIADYSRFDLEQVKAKAAAEKRKAKVKLIVQNIVLVIVLVIVAVMAKIGWNMWQEYRQKVAREEAEARYAEERAAVERAQREAELREQARLEREKREAERRAQEEKREAERLEREAKRQAELKAREEAAAAREREKAEKIVQEERKQFAERAVRALQFKIADHIVCESGLDEFLDLSVDGRQWNDLSFAASRESPMAFIQSLTQDANEYSELNYPDHDTFMKLLKSLDKVKFVLVIGNRMPDSGSRYVVAVPDPVSGLKEPEGSRAVKQGSKISAWTVPFLYGDEYPIFFMKDSTAKRIVREWQKRRSELKKMAEKVVDRDEFIKAQLERELPDFVSSIRIELSQPPKPAPKKDENAGKERRKNRPKPTLKGSHDDIRSFRR